MDQNRNERLPASLRVLIDSLILWWDEWISMWIVGLIWGLSWLTIFLGPPATFGMCYVAFHLSRGESIGIRGMIEGARRYFVKSWLWMLFNVIVLILLLMNILFYGGISANWARWLLYLMYFFAILWIIIQFYALGYLMEQENESIRLALRNSLFTILSAPGYTAILAGVVLGIIWLTLNYYVPILMGGPAFIAVLRAGAVRNRLSAYGAYKEQDPPT